MTLYGIYFDLSYAKELGMNEIGLFTDVHHHFNPLKEHDASWSLRCKTGFSHTDWEISKTLDMLNENNIQRCVLSYPMHYFMLNSAERVGLCEITNERMAEITSKYEQLGSFAVLPFLAGKEEEIQALEYALDVLEMDGVILPTEILNKEYEHGELYEELNRRKATVFVHPDISTLETGSRVGFTGYATKVTHAAFHLAFNKIVLKYPHIKFIMSYGGGKIPFYFNFLKYKIPENRAVYQYRIDRMLRRLYFDTAYPAKELDMLSYLIDFVDMSQITLGSNFPYFPHGQIKKLRKNKYWQIFFNGV